MAGTVGPGGVHRPCWKPTPRSCRFSTVPVLRTVTSAHRDRLRSLGNLHHATCRRLAYDRGLRAERQQSSGAKCIPRAAPQRWSLEYVHGVECDRQPVSRSYLQAVPATSCVDCRERRGDKSRPAQSLHRLSSRLQDMSRVESGTFIKAAACLHNVAKNRLEIEFERLLHLRRMPT